MGKYVSICFRHRLEGRSPTALVHAPRLAPVSLFGIGPHGRMNDVFVAGFAIEIFLNQLFDPRRVSRLDVARTPTSARPYLERFASTRRWERFSPFETEHALLTRVSNEASLGEETFTELEAWRASQARAHVECLYSIDLATAEGSWDRCLNVVVDAVDPRARGSLPLVCLTMARSPFDPELTEMRVTSSGSAFVPDGISMGPAIGRVEADENLARFARFCGALAQTNPGLVEATLDVDGRDHRANEGRIREAIEAEVGIPCSSLD